MEGDQHYRNPIASHDEWLRARPELLGSEKGVSADQTSLNCTTVSVAAQAADFRPGMPIAMAQVLVSSASESRHICHSRGP